MTAAEPASVATWLEEQGFAQYVRLFDDNAIDYELLPTLSEADLRSLGLPFGHARKLALAAARLGEPAPAPKATGDAAGSAAERRQLTVMFCDLVGSTALSSKLDPEDLRAVIRSYHKVCGEVVDRYGGFVAQYLGDGVLVYFGYPQAQEDAAERAVRCGLEIIATVAAMKLPVPEPIEVRVGAATGLAVVGDLIGQGASEQAAVIGQTPNLAARVQSLAEPGTMVIAEATRKLAGDVFEYLDLGPQKLKGIDGPVRVLVVVGERKYAMRFESTRSSRVACFGRQREIDFLLQRWREAGQGSGQVVYAWGEAGIGKSRLLRQFGEQLRDQEFIRIHAQCSPQHLASPLYPVISAIQRFVGLQPGETGEEKLAKLRGFLAGGNLEECLPLLAAMMNVPVDVAAAPMTAAEQRARTLQMCVDFVVNLAARLPVVYQLEDVQWLDPTTGELLERLIRMLPGQRVLLMVTGRPEYRPDWLGEPQASTLDLGRLGEAEIRLMVKAIAGKEIPETMIQQILEKTDGVPLFVEELTRTILESGLLRDSGDSLVLDGPLPPMSIPLTLQDSLMARLDRLASAKEVVQIAAVIGRGFSHALLAAVLDRPEPTLHAALARLVESGLINPRGEPPGTAYCFKHAMVQEVAYESLLRSRRVLLHARIVRALETHFGDIVENQPELIAYHALRADLADQAVRYCLIAGRRAAARSAHREALQLLGDAIARLGSIGDPKRRDEQELELQLALGQSCLALHGYSAHETAAAFTRARELADRVERPVGYYELLFGLYASDVIHGRLNAAEEFARRFLGRAVRDGDDGYHCIGHRMVGVVAFYRGQLGEARVHLQEAVDLHHPDRHRELAGRFGTDIGVTAQNYLAWIDSIAGDLDSALARVDGALERAWRLNHALTVAQTLHLRCVAMATVRDFDRLLPASQEALAFTEEKNLGYFRFWARNFKAYAEAMLGEPQAFFKLREHLPGLPDFNKSVAVWWFHSWAGEVLLKQGQPAEAMRELNVARALVAVSDERWGQAEIERLQGVCVLSQGGAPGEAEAFLRNALACAATAGANIFALRAAVQCCQLLVGQGRGQEGRTLLVPWVERFSTGISLAELEQARQLLGR